jgi:hypothetical protein
MKRHGHVEYAASLCREPRPLIEEVQTSSAATQVATPPKATGHQPGAGGGQIANAGGPPSSSKPGTSKANSTGAATSGLKGGFFNRSAKPKKGILKHSEPVATMELPGDNESNTVQMLRPTTFHGVQQLVQQDFDAFESARRAAFTGCVRERDPASQVRVALETSGSCGSDELQLMAYVTLVHV